MIADLLRLAEAYGAFEGIEPSTVSWRVFGDTKKLAALSGGADIQSRRGEAALAWFAANWPAGAEWPAGVGRPEHAAEPADPAQPAHENPQPKSLQGAST